MSITTHIHDYNTIKNEPIVYDNRERILLIDGDSLVYLSCYFPNNNIFLSDEEKWKEIKYRINNKLQQIQSNVEKWFNIKQTLIFIKGNNNFRYKLYSAYKNNRSKEKPEFFLEAINYLKELGAISSNNCEADDYIFTCYKKCFGNCVCASIDKDLLYHLPDVPIYSYKNSGEWKRITNEESRLLIVKQIIEGDISDGVKGAKGIGKVWCNKNLKLGMTNYQFIKMCLLAYLKSTKNNSVDAKKQLRMNYKLLKLWTLEEVENLIL